ncbi:hypothetical protein [Asticcacaulis sp. W401b]|uniref:hypothetical protein n=1 Tax=Asticcacaulis sp. W401b TaxID=3388666 RepID=UPI003970632E
MKTVKSLPLAGMFALALVWSSGPSNAQVPVQELEFKIKTGGDDLRDGALLFGQVILPNGSEQPRFRINLRNGRPVALQNGTETVFRVNLPAPIPAADFAKAKFVLTHDGEPRNFGEGYDNWDLQGFSVSTVPTCKGGETVTETPAATSWARFTGADTDRIFPVVVAGSQKNDTPNALVLKITTGEDDRRSNADTKAFLTLKGGKRLPAVFVTGTTGALPWVTLPLPEKTKLADVESLTIIHNGAGGRTVTESYDNWDVKRLSLALPVVCKSTQFLSVNGAPWKRFTGSDRNATIPMGTRETIVPKPIVGGSVSFEGGGF